MKSKKTNEEKDLVSVSTFAKRAGRDRQEIYKMITPQLIIPCKIDKRVFIDVNVYDPENFKK